jgi:GTPase SAR1 family protein
MRILMVGLDAAGKTTILYKLKLGEGEFPQVANFRKAQTLLVRDITTWTHCV